jgi:hypothetical protein
MKAFSHLPFHPNANDFMRKKIDLQRLKKVKEDIALLGLRFPVTTIAKRTGCDKGNISKALRGKVLCSNKFINRFYASFQAELDKARSPSSSKRL